MHESLISRIWHHKLFISVALTQTGAVRGVTLRSSWCVLLVGIIFLGANYIKPLNNTVLYSIQADMKKSEEVKSLRKENLFYEEQLKVLAGEFGILQARLDRFDIMGEKLLSDEKINQLLGNVENLEGQGSATAPVIEHVPSIDELHSSLGLLHKRADKVEVVMASGLELLNRNNAYAVKKPNIWPVVHHRTYKSSNYGNRKDPFSGRRKWHSGIDIAGGYNAPIVASADGIVVFSGYRYNYGTAVEIRHSGGFTTRYAHLKESLVKNGQQVNGGELIALMGSTGRSTGPHLHFEVLVGDNKVDPTPFIRSDKNRARRLAREKSSDYIPHS